MKAAEDFPVEKLVLGVLFTSKDQLLPLEKHLIDTFGNIDFTSQIHPFTFSTYYDSEMGEGIQKIFYSFTSLIQPTELAPVKLKTNALESLLSQGTKRTVNLDPGILNYKRLILATTKDQSHRIPLDKGIYGELTLQFSKGDFHPLPWTYADFRSREYRDILMEIRTLYKNQLKNS